MMDRVRFTDDEGQYVEGTLLSVCINDGFPYARYKLTTVKYIYPTYS